MLSGKQFINYVTEKNLFQKNDHLLLTVSGGVDSVVLCYLCHEAGFHFTILHCNFQLRGAESERDEQFVRSLADKFDVKALVKRFETKQIALEQKKSIQETARILRYVWFFDIWKEMMQSENLNKNSKSSISINAGRNPLPYYVVTAHHANDNIETLLMNFFKGTGIKGMHGILPKSGIKNHIIRPLLFAKKEEIIKFAEENNLSFVEDSSNSSDKYTRNYFRNQLIPELKKVYPDVEDNLQKNIERFGEIETLYHQSVALHKKKLLEYKGNEVQIPVLKLLKTEPLKTIIYEVIKEYGFTAHQTEEVVSLLKSESGKYVSSLTHRIIKNRAWLIIIPLNTLEADHILINKNDKEVFFEEGKLTFKIEKIVVNVREKTSYLPYQASASIATVDVSAVTFPLLLRKWKQGDYFYPLGMKGKKKLSKFFIDIKLSLPEKEKAWVIESNKKILWVIGKRIDDRFKITEKTKEVLSIGLV